jgi:hypothetical protein
MKNYSLRIFLMFSFLAILTTASAYAQSSNEQTANIPFSFIVGSKTFPAGEYKVVRLNPQSDKAALAIKSADGRLNKIVLTTPIQANEVSERAKLIFNRYDDQYFLVQVWTPADNTGLELPKSRSERTLARHAGENRAERVAIALGARRR